MQREDQTQNFKNTVTYAGSWGKSSYSCGVVLSFILSGGAFAQDKNLWQYLPGEATSPGKESFESTEVKQILEQEGSSKKKSTIARSLRSHTIDAQVSYFDEKLGIGFVNVGSRDGVEDGTRACLLLDDGRMGACSTIIAPTAESSQIRFRNPPPLTSKLRIFLDTANHRGSSLYVFHARDLKSPFLIEIPSYVTESMAQEGNDPATQGRWQRYKLAYNDHGSFGVTLQSRISDRAELGLDLTGRKMFSKRSQVDLPDAFTGVGTHGSIEHRIRSVGSSLSALGLWPLGSWSLLYGLGFQLDYLEYRYRFFLESEPGSKRELAKGLLNIGMLSPKATLGMRYQGRTWSYGLLLNEVVFGRTFSRNQISGYSAESEVLPGFKDSKQDFDQSFSLNRRRSSLQFLLVIGVIQGS